MARLEHIGLDVDGVLRDLATWLVEVFEREFPDHRGRHMPIDQWPDWWGFERYFPQEVEFYRFAKRFLPEIMRDARPYPDVAAFLERLASERTVHIVTSQPSPVSESMTRAWLAANGVPVPDERVHITSTKEQAPIQLLVDDMAHNLEAVQLAGIVGVCLDRPWNRGWEGFRIYRLEELFDLLPRLERE